MPFKSLALRPGVNTQLSKTLLGDSYSVSQLVRFLGGQPQKLGGWVHLSSTPLIGTCRGMCGWSNSVGNNFLACGTEQKLEVYFQGNFYDITPITRTSTVNAATAFSASAGLVSVQITDAGYAPTVGDWINIVMPVSIGAAGNALVIYGQYQVISTNGPANTYTINAITPAPSTSTAGAVPFYTTLIGTGTIVCTLNSHGYVVGNSFTVHYSTAVGGLTIAPVVLNASAAQTSPPTPYVITAKTTDTFTFLVAAVAGASASAYENGANSAVIQYFLPNGYVINTQTVYGNNSLYGSGIYGAGIYGGFTTLVPPIQYLRQWCFNTWGEQLIANPSGLGLYAWTPVNSTANPLALITPATPITNAPLYNTWSLVIPQAQILVSLGSETGGVFFPSLIKWSTVSDYNTWTATAANQAGSFQIPTGTPIVTGLVSGLTVLIWTQTDLWTMTYQGLPFVFSFQKVGINCETLSARSVGVLGQLTCWPSQRGFYSYDGSSVQQLPCPVWDFYFNNFDTTQSEQAFCGTNTIFTEFMWFFPFNDHSGSIGYVKYNMSEWDYGTLKRTAWVDHTTIGNPMAADDMKLVQQHDLGNDADGVAMVSYITSGFTPIGDGEDFYYVDAFFPDIVTDGTSPTMTITFFGATSQNATPVSYGPYTFTPTTEYVSVRIRGRLLSYTLQSADMGSFWRVGKPYLRIAPCGRR